MVIFIKVEPINLDVGFFVFVLISLLILQALKEGREPDLSDYKEFKLTCENIGYQMLQRLGWQEGEGLGSENQGIKNPVNK